MSEINPGAAFSIEAVPSRTITLQIDEAVLRQGVQTSEFELPDAEFEV